MAVFVATHEGTGERTFQLGGSLTEASGGAAAAILAILGLVHIAPAMLLGIATIVVGGSFLLLGGVLAARMTAVRTEGAVTQHTLTEGLALASLCGATSIVLGIIGLVGMNLAVLVPVAAIVLGAALVAISGSAARFEVGVPAYMTPSSDGLIGLAGIVLGVLALSGFAPIELSLVAMLSFGVALMLKGTALASSFVSFFRS